METSTTPHKRRKNWKSAILAPLSFALNTDVLCPEWKLTTDATSMRNRSVAHQYLCFAAMLTFNVAKYVSITRDDFRKRLAKSCSTQPALSPPDHGEHCRRGCLPVCTTVRHKQTM
eukprot:4000879-Amphidinium_carterae.1